MRRAPLPFPIDRLSEIPERPDDFRLLERIPLSIDQQWPMQLAPQVGDERPIVLLDTETTGGSPRNSSMIELGMVKVLYSPSAQRLTSIQDAISLFEDPGTPIPPFITELTGISDDMVQGHRLDQHLVAQWLEDDPLVVAHNAQFDRPFFEKHLPKLDDLTWGCSARNIKWSDLGFESRKLEYLLLRLGWFYDAHRATTDCFAMAWLFHHVPEAVAQLWENASEDTVIVRAFGAPYNVKDDLKGRGYRWQASGDKHWWKEIPDSKLAKEQAFLDELYHRGSKMARYDYMDARSRYK